jgi:hypothetical protein
MNKTLKLASSLLAVALLAIPFTLFAQTEGEGESDSGIAVGAAESVVGLPASVNSAITMGLEKATGIPLSYGSVAEAIAKRAGAGAIAGPIGVASDLTFSSTPIATDEEEGSPGTLEVQAISATQKMQAEAASVSVASTQALQNLQQQVSPDSATVNAFQQVQQAANDLVAATPDEATIHDSILGTSIQETQNVPPLTVQQDDDDQGDQDAEADGTNDNDDDAVPYPTALQNYQQALQNLAQTTIQHTWQSIPSPAQMQQSRSPEIKNGGSAPASQCVGQRCY